MGLLSDVDANPGREISPVCGVAPVGVVWIVIPVIACVIGGDDRATRQVKTGHEQYNHHKRKYYVGHIHFFAAYWLYSSVAA